MVEDTQCDVLSMGRQGWDPGETVRTKEGSTVKGEILPVYMLLQDSVLGTIVNSNGEDMTIKGHMQDRVLINIVKSNGEDVLIKGQKQDRVLINIVNSNGRT